MKEAADLFDEDRVMRFPTNGYDDELSSLFLRRIRQDYDVISYREYWKELNGDLSSGRASGIGCIPESQLEPVICKKKENSKRFYERLRPHPSSAAEATLAANKLPVASPTPGFRKLLDSLSATVLSCSSYHESNEPPQLPGPLSAIEDPDSLLDAFYMNRIPMSPEIYKLFHVADVLLRGLSLSRVFLASGDSSEKRVRAFNESLRLILSSG